MLKTKGNVYEVRPFPEGGLINIHNIDFETIKPRSGERKHAEMMLRDLGLNKTEVQKVLKNNPTYLEALDRLVALSNADRLKGVQGTKLIKLQDWFMENVVPGDAALYRNNMTAGVGHKAQNALYIKKSTLDRMGKKQKQALEVLDQYEPNADFNKRPTKAELQEFAEDYANPTTDRYHDADAAAELESTSLNPVNDPAVAELNEIVEGHKETLKAMDEAGELDADDLQLFEELDEMSAVHEKELEIARDGFNCQIGL
jgi:hypothetical protein